MTAQVKITTSRDIQPFIILAVALLILGNVLLSPAASRFPNEGDPQSQSFRQSPLTSSPLNSDPVSGFSSLNTEFPQERIPEGNLLQALSGLYNGAILLPEAEIFGQAELFISPGKFSLRPKERRELSGSLTAENRGEYVELKLVFDKRNARANGNSSQSSIIASAHYVQTELPNLFLRATLPTDGKGWLIKNAPNEKHDVLFAPTNCPNYPYCKPVRRCRPCDPPR